MSKTVKVILIGTLVFVLVGGAAAFVFLRGSTSLDGTSWRLTRWSASSPDPADFLINAQFRNGEIGGNSAVNSYGGPYKAGLLGAFSAGPINSTLIAGPEDAMRAEQTYLELLDRASHYERTDSTLVLSEENGTALLTFEPMEQ